MSPLQSFALLAVLAVGAWAAALVLTDLTRRLSERLHPEGEPDGD